MKESVIVLVSGVGLLVVNLAALAVFLILSPLLLVAWLLFLIADASR